MNVSFFSDINVLGGGELWVLNMNRALTARGHQVSIACPDRSQLFQSCLDAGHDVHGFSLTSRLPVEEPLYHFFGSRDTDVVYCTVIGRTCESEILTRLVRRLNTARKKAKAIVILKTGLPPMPSLSSTHYGLSGEPEVRRLHVVSEDSKQQFRQVYGGRTEIDEFVQVMREGVDLARFHPNGHDRNETRASYGFGPDELLITCTSRLHPSKGQTNLLRAARSVVDAVPMARFVLAGAGEDLEGLEHLRDSFGLRDKVRFAGHVDDVATLLDASDIFCHPSLWDGLPNAVAEAMAMSLPIVASDAGGVPEIIRDGVNGLLFPAQDTTALTQRLIALATSPELRERIAGHAGADARRELAFDGRAESWEQAITDELSHFRALDEPSSVPSKSAVNACSVLFLMSHLRTGGEEKELALLARYLDRQRHPLSVVIETTVEEASPVPDTLRALRVPIDSTCAQMHDFAEKAQYIANKIRREGIRIVVACQSTSLAYEVFRRLPPGECKLIEHAGIPMEVRQIPKDYTSALVGVSNAIAAEARPLFPDPGRVRTLPSMVDTEAVDQIDREAVRLAYGVNMDRIVVFVGRLDAKKGIEYIIAAARELLPEFGNLRFLIVGPPDAFQLEYGQRLMRSASDLPDDRFIFTGLRSDVAHLLRAADVLVLPSVGEGMSHVINEAGACRLPVIAFDDGAAREQLDGGSAGILVTPGDRHGFVQRLRELLGDPQQRERLGRMLRERVERDYSTHNIVPRWHSLFAEVDAEKRQHPQQLAGTAFIAGYETPPFPAEIQIETNTVCNAKCVMCPYPEVSKEIPGGSMELDLYEKILSECAEDTTVQRLEPFLNNEPFTDKRLVDWIALAKQRVPHAVVTVTTNGSLLTPKVTDRLIESGLDAIWFSFNGATKETYEKIMGISFDRVKRNIDYLLSVKPPGLQVLTNMIDTVPMKGELADNIRYWQSRGVQSGASPLVNRAGNVANFDELNYKPTSTSAARICDLLYHKMYVGFNGDVLLCCMDWRRRVVLGNVREQTLREVWQGEKYRRFRDLHEQGRIDELELCADCSYVRS